MPDNDWALAQNTVDFRNEERLAGNGRSSAMQALHRAMQAQQDHERRIPVQLTLSPLNLTLRCPVCDRRADMCFDHGDWWKKR